ncbi:MAG TPA: hypothetical protein VN697_13145 [Tepidiformaceae bacterium]|nr:hypothetical protein [Tepidiformaceae bacterium]
MMFPKDRSLYSNLNTSFTDFEGLLADLSGRKLTGYVQVSFPGYEAVLFMANGEPRTAIEERELARTTGNAAASGLAARVRDKSGVINVYALTPEMLQLLLWTVDAEVLYKDLTSSFTNLDRLVAKLEEDRLTGYVEILFANGKGSAMVFIEGGRTVECVLYADGQSATGPEVYQTVIQHSAAVGASFNVYRVQQEQPAAVAPTPSPLPLAPEQAAEGPQLLALWGEILGRVEEVVDSLSKPGRFVSAFKEVLVARAATYPFLDPFAAEFEYKAGTIRFESALPGDFNRGLGDCLTDTISRLAFQLKRADLESRVRMELSELTERNAGLIEQLNLADDLQEFVA